MVSSHHPIKLAVRGRTSPTSYHQRNQQRGSVHPDAEPLVHHRGRFASAVGMRWQVVHAETQHRRFGSAGHVRPPQEYQRKYSIAGDAKNDSTVIALASHWHRTVQAAQFKQAQDAGLILLASQRPTFHVPRAGKRAWINCINRSLTAPTHSANLRFSL